jgi:Tol biopolymer transport system component
MTRILSLFLMFIVLPLAFLAQSTSPNSPNQKKDRFLIEEADVRIFDKGEFYFNELNYNLALQEYKKLEVRFPDEPVLLFRIGVCYINSNGDKSKSLAYLNRLDKNKFKKTDLIYYLGRASHLNYKFDEAIVYYTEFMNSKRGLEKQKQVAHLIENCQFGKELYAHPGNAKIVNLGPPVNTENSEYAPSVSSDESTLIFTYTGPLCQGGLQSEPGVPNDTGQYFEDIFESHRDSSGHWSAPQPVEGINTNGPDAAISLSNDGQKLFVFKNSPGDVGDIYMSRLEGAHWTEPERLRGDVNSPAWEGSASLSSDEHTLYFSSERPGGFGGRDIYSAILQADGSWGQVKNLGPKINTEYNDDSPIIHPDGVSLYFNSEGHNSMGGNDIFISVLVDDSVWLDPVNLGYPINTPDDDDYFYPATDGNHGYYSSGKEGGLGQQDIYIVEGLGRKTRLVMVKGLVLVDDKPVDGTITVMNERKGTEQIFHSNSATGKYLMNLKPGNDFKIKFKINGFDEQVKNLSTMKVDSFLESTIDVQFYTDAYKARLKRMQDSLKLKKDTLKGQEGNMTLAEMIAKFGDKKIEDLDFRVQVGAFNLPDNFNYTALLKMGKVQKNKSEDGITRFTIGHKKTLNEVYDLKKRVVKAGIKDSFVTAVYKGKRMLLKDLLVQHVFDN